jgi:hypothetical protein
MDAIASVLARLYPDGDWPRPFHLIRGALLVKEGSDIKSAAKEVGTSAAKLKAVTEAVDPLTEALGEGIHIVDDALVSRVRFNIGLLLVGRAAELAFEEIYKERLTSREFELHDVREGRTSTDYRIYNGGGRPLYRINVKFVRPLFRRSREMVGLETSDCFPLATYKIKQALDKQDEEHLPYIFIVVAVVDLDPAAIAPMIRADEVEFLARLIKAGKGGRQNIEDRILVRAVTERSPAFVAAYERIRASPWYALSARRAERLLKDRLFERVFALRVRGFAQQWRNAEVDMHFSLSNDLMALDGFLAELSRRGPHVVTGMLERGTI